MKTKNSVDGLSETARPRQGPRQGKEERYPGRGGRRPVRFGMALWLALAAGPLPQALSAQVIPVKTVPVATGDQFLLFPAENLAMGGLGLALPDTLGDPFGNPAAGARLGESLVFASPTAYRISRGNGSGRTLPLGVLFSSGRWFGGGALAIQEVEAAQGQQVWVWRGGPTDRLWVPPPPFEPLAERSARNLFAHAHLGYRSPRPGLSFGMGVLGGDLRAMDGVDLLYAMSSGIRQSGSFSDLRLGVLREWEGGKALEAVLLREQVRMRHDVTYLDLVWEPLPPDSFAVPQWRRRVEKNLDHSTTTGLHLAYRQPLAVAGWSTGWSFTVNRKDHPKIPNYEIQNIPRDPGETWAFSFGGGIGLAEGPLRFGADVFLEPIWSDTWADAARDTVSVKGDKIPAGSKTVENDFRFLNLLVRAGASYTWREATFQAGVQIRSVGYELEQVDHIAVRTRTQDESWMEWTPSAGLTLDLGRARIHYVGRLVTGTGRPGTRWEEGAMARRGLEALAKADFLVAPQGPLTLQEAEVTTHRIGIAIPIR